MLSQNSRLIHLSSASFLLCPYFILFLEKDQASSDLRQSLEKNDNLFCQSLRFVLNVSWKQRQTLQDVLA